MSKKKERIARKAPNLGDPIYNKRGHRIGFVRNARIECDRIDITRCSDTYTRYLLDRRLMIEIQQ